VADALQNAHVAFAEPGWQTRQDVHGDRPAASGRQLLDMAGDGQASRPLLPHPISRPKMTEVIFKDVGSMMGRLHGRPTCLWTRRPTNDDNRGRRSCRAFAANLLFFLTMLLNFAQYTPLKTYSLRHTILPVEVALR
jgi:hypothetical protein